MTQPTAFHGGVECVHVDMDDLAQGKGTVLGDYAGRRMPSSFRKRRVLRLAAPARPAMFRERVPLGDATEGRCTEVGEVLQLKEGTVIRTCRFESAQQLQPNRTHWRAIVGP
jgi:hypothetical protein